MQFAVQEGRTIGGLVGALDVVAQTVFRVTGYAKYFAIAGPVVDTVLELLRTDLIHLYTKALNLLIRGRVFFSEVVTK